MSNLKQKPTGAQTGAEPVWKFLTATRDPAAFRTARGEQLNFNLADVDGVDEVQLLIWEMRVQFDAISVQEGIELDTYVAAQLEAEPSKTADAARAWLLDTSAKQYSRKSAMKIALDFISSSEPAFKFSTDSALDNELGSIEWIWQNYIPRGFVTALVAEQDAGKSTVAQNLCQTLLIGGRWPSGQQCDIKAPAILWVDTDGNLPLFHQRLKDWKMPRGRFIFPPDTLQELAIDNPENWRWIERAIEKFNIPLLVIDALSGSHNGKSNDEDSMKVIMKRLHALAQKYKIAIIVLHHLNKAPFGQASYPITIDRLRGSGAISQYCRSILALTTPDPTRLDERRLDVIKLNLAKKPPAVGYSLTDNGPAWGAAPEPPQPRRAADEAADWLRDFLGDNVKPTDEVNEAARAAGIGETAMKNARKSLGVETRREGGTNGKWFLAMHFKNSADPENREGAC